MTIGFLSFSMASAETPQKVERTVGSNGVTKLTIKSKTAPPRRAPVKRNKKASEFRVYDLGGDTGDDQASEIETASRAPRRQTTVVAQPPPIYPQNSGYWNGGWNNFGPGFFPVNGQRFRGSRRYRGNRQFQGQSALVTQPLRSPLNYQVPPLNYQVPPLNPGLNSSRYYQYSGGFNQFQQGRSYRGFRGGFQRGFIGGFRGGFGPGCR